MFNFIYLIIQVQSFRIRQIQNDSLSFELPFFQETNITSLYSAKDTLLISNNTQNFCWLEQLNLNYDTKLQPFDKIVTMAHIRDGILVITSDFFLYMLKFNYQNFSSEFAKISWKADFKELGLDSSAEMPSLLFCGTSNLGILFYSWTAMIFSVQQMEQKSTSLSVKELSELKQRRERGVTKEYDNFIFSCVGQDGLDIYKISGTELHYIDQIPGYRVKDLTIIKQEQTFYLILIEDTTPSILIYSMDVTKIKITIKQQYQLITKKREYVAIDNHKNNVFVVYQSHHKYICVEYLFAKNELTQLNEFQTFSKIKDVDVTEDFAILQGQDKHKIMFVTKFDGLQIKNVPKFTISGVMDIDFFYLTNIDLSMSHLQEQNNYSLEKFFFGSSKNGLFFTRYKFQDPYFACYAEGQVEEKEQFYQIVTNESVSFQGEIASSLIVQRTTNITITAFDDSSNGYITIVAYLGIPIGGTMLLMGIISWYFSKKKEVEKLETEISTIRSSRKISVLNGQVEFQPQIMQIINSPGITSPIAITARNDLQTNLNKEENANADG